MKKLIPYINLPVSDLNPGGTLFFSAKISREINAIALLTDKVLVANIRILLTFRTMLRKDHKQFIFYHLMIRILMNCLKRKFYHFHRLFFEIKFTVLGTNEIDDLDESVWIIRLFAGDNSPNS